MGGDMTLILASRDNIYSGSPLDRAAERIAAMGANDSEFFSLGLISEKLDKGEIEPGEAAEEARSILSAKQDYH